MAKNLLLSFLICLTTSQLFTADLYAQCNLQKPKNLSVTSITGCSAVVSWTPVSGTAYYEVRYKQGSGAYQYINTGLNTTWQADGLLSNKNYSFSVASYCSNNQSKGYSKAVKIKTLACSAPTAITVSAIAKHKATIQWQPVCNGTLFNLQYRASGSTAWLTVSNIANNGYQLTQLTMGTTYEFQLQTVCTGSNSAFTPLQTFTTTGGVPDAKPNILAIMVDDGRYDIYQPNGGPAWFETPAINRIANEGVNFRLTFPATSQCAPSRATFYTGLYPHKHGCIINGDHMYDSLPLIQQILKDNGYYTGFVGKYGQNLGLPQGFDWYAISQSDNYVDVVYTINGLDTFIAGHISDIYPQLALQFLNQVPEGQPFALFYFHRAPHGPTVPRPEDALLYTTDTIPFPSNFYKYQHDYPSFYYASVYKWPYDSLETDTAKLQEYQAIAGVEDNTDTLTDWLESKNILDNTFLMYTSDNGYIKGEHLLQGKGLAQDESIRLPLFIRYPKWFAPGAVISNEEAANFDIAPTMLELAGIPDTFGMDGVSLHKLYTHDVSRKEFFYEFGGTGTVVPPLRSVRTLQYKYNYYYCNSTTEEFFDLVNDPDENENLISNPAYSVLIQSYREKLDSLRTAYGDYEPVKIPCSLSHPTIVKTTAVVAPPDEAMQFSISPNPAADNFKIQYTGAAIRQGEIMVMDVLGKIVFSKTVSGWDIPADIRCRTWPAGIYQVKLIADGQSMSARITVVH
ncbi:MAG: sulfatase-like hydrolase/transferase [Chitinophagales bacterium]|nr:sulfatase-like hydrolase/transferase [Chitinophagales bacterium]